MPLLGFSVGPWLWGIGLSALAAGLVWLVDEIGDRREAKVRAEIAAEVVAANRRADEVGRKWAAQYQADAAERAQRLEAILASAKGSVGCAPAPDLVDKLNAINPRRR